MSVFDFRDASFRGDARWSNTSKFTSLAPPLVLFLLLLAIIQIALGAVYISSIQSAQNDLSFAQVIQPLIIPALSFFNTVPSLHLHVLARSNNPLMAMWFSGVMGVLYLASAVVYLPPCVKRDWGVGKGTFAGQEKERGYAGTECPRGSRKGVWIAVVVLQFLSAIGYTAHFGMAWWVRRKERRRERDEREGRVLVVIDPAKKAEREEEARQRWREIRDL